eukprot:c8655_g1_i1.p1 GENE.c8655_g1_i1~~c8655_g1_i1.p1  ORF type:complete len:269 (+),score=65.90 c8655_g1_i1:37-843(+)
MAVWTVLLVLVFCFLTRAELLSVFKDIHGGLGGDTWRRPWPETLEGNPCEWSGVHCVEDSVVGLALENNLLHGMLSASIAQFQKARFFLFHGNEISGTIPEEITKLPLLEQLTLSNNNLRGPLPVGLGRMPQLRYLDISNYPGFGHTIANKFVQQLPDMMFTESSQIQELYMGGVGLVGTIPSTLFMMPKLRELSLTQNELTGFIPDLSPSTVSPFLRSVMLAWNSLEGSAPAWMRSAPLLRVVTLDHNAQSSNFKSENSQHFLVWSA